MTALLIELAVALLVIFVGSKAFTNALEHLGERLHISQGVTGSLFAAVGTALPETVVPLLAVLTGAGRESVNQEVGVGAILGAPLMLSTLSTCLMAVFVIRSRGTSGRIQPERSGFVRDLNFFLFAFVLAAAAMYVPPAEHIFRVFMGLTLVATYAVYVVRTFQASPRLVANGHGTEVGGPLYLSGTGLPDNLVVEVLQLLVGLGLLLGGAKAFIDAVESASRHLGVSALLLSLLVIPIATELPEKVNSIVWARARQDTLAFGNITGAMVFQGTLLPAIGITLTPWTPRIEVLTGVAVTLLAAAWLRANARQGGLPIWALLANGALYASYLVVTLRR